MNQDEHYMGLAIEAARNARHRSSPNPWVGAVLVGADGSVVSGSTQAYGGAHAETMALNEATNAQGATLYTTLEPCNHTGRTGACTEALIGAGISRVVAAIQDPDRLVAGRGIERLRQADIDVTIGVRAEEVELQLRPYLHHRRTGRPWVVLKLATTLDGRVAASDATSQWITGTQALADVHRLRAISDAIVVGAGTVRADDPSLTVRHWPGEDQTVDPEEVRDPRRIVLGSVHRAAKVNPCLEWDLGLDELLEHLGDSGVVQLLVEGGPTVAHSFHSARLVDHYVFYVAPALMGGDDGAGLFSGPGAGTINEIWRAKFESVQELGDDVRIDLYAQN
ncbi:MAG: bifunctional diaminohydroxyphosphoribosylaminopyrimidine deaminase/5-amino-6-(5-phosphoribosylamino)uracil reductase RibD [Acidimicrobiaceae bacterium]|nr:bifunctional diaminohydroxyphosphoribosylaminopyrimidine deaminase/5-amino-6-(5-phosphoribosylamino)uracil reductase RibD [Acidimicrobiaceae bacterium]MYG54150.1 bifunctional diaminohydroxyphosphoribosylaminopyrimidine deaminase/5-amino-6-(5-phosphoribosylamino)uracil reductase RibD [Acidimicrobiaceae bacterium]MYG56168.1 bifunctional diaminohydroxyphosphoribosylaminopyrimidine deaminase/5-amino-6-(5-phosphoribosylamino)uracil reductase RibD [Acidimicrobiaceae bacterium]MYJ99888.1 bifunctiona